MKFQSIISSIALFAGLTSATPTPTPAIDAIDAADSFQTFHVIESSDNTDSTLLKNQLNFNGKYKFRKATGSTQIRLYNTGKVQWSGKFHDSGALSYDYSVACAIRDGKGKTYTLSHKGTIKGGLAAGSRTSKWNQNRTSAWIKKNWADVNKSKFTCKAKVNWNIKNAINEIVKDVKKYGPLVKGIIALF